MIKPVPDKYHTLTPSFTFKDSDKAIEFYKKAFGAELVDYMPNLNGKGVMHATLQIGNSMFMMGDEMPGSENCPKSAETTGSCPISLFVYVPNVDQVFRQAVAAGGKEIMPVAEMFWGDRVGQIKDPFGYQWMIGTHTRDLTKDQIRQEAEEFFAKFAGR